MIPAPGAAVWDAGFRSLWAETSREPAPDCPPLAGEVTADVLVIGAGYAGLSAAIHLADRGARVVVLEAEAPGHGGSGRNGGQVIPGIRHFRQDCVDAFGAERGDRLYRFGAGAQDAVWSFIDRFAIACDDVRRGWVQAAHGAASLALGRQRAAAWQRFGAPVELLDAAAIARLTGSHEYVGGFVDRRGGHLNPLAYARGLARGALSLGVAVHGASRVTALAADGPGFLARTAGGAVRARRVVVATTGYSDGLIPGLSASILPVQSFQVATAPLSAGQRGRILANGEAVSDTRNLLRYFRLDRDGRLVVGGRGTLRPARGLASFSLVRMTLGKLYPELADAPITHWWGGFVAVALPERWPRLHQPAPGLFVSMGCNGKGVAWASAFGSVLADAALGAAEASLPLPVTPVPRIPLPALRRIYQAIGTAWYRLLDARG
ncbi:MAG: FAD-binding oxidoreductase [Thalassobaculales bacterium]